MKPVKGNCACSDGPQRAGIAEALARGEDVSIVGCGRFPNKRIGSLLFLLYLKQEGIEHGLNPQALTALTLLVAESAPTGKDLMIRLIVNLLAGASK